MDFIRLRMSPFTQAFMSHLGLLPWKRWPQVYLLLLAMLAGYGKSSNTMLLGQQRMRVMSILSHGALIVF
jgi:hypothetical protein